ncbi:MULTISPECIES: heme o synthase [unclassified Corynebacterium]|uniref:heme o synthase n=1 Tax=unclassified Corynebacterium TaxID=2624378 RepID=UPI001C4963FE|nr:MULTISPECIES: heme o synthase [unclassified Corynebacterium]MBV7280926.1 heme o synthase [Corynebacterium sp. TAE3-ERU30]MBV7302652.1 heme o synthase [Corynebacterium sp. TAE3-ERU2]
METIKAYFALTKPRVIELLLVATFPAMLQADRGSIDLVLILLTLIGGWMGAAAANTFNMVADADIDQVMARTSTRPLVKSSVSTRNAAVFAWALTVASFLWLWLLCGSLTAAMLVMVTIAFYIFVYTKWLKRRTPMNVVWGGAAGCMPVLVGWAVITDNIPNLANAQWWQAIVLFLIIFFWTPPHTWALGMKYKKDYAAAGVPMLPVVATETQVTKQIVVYTWITVATTLLLLPATGWIYAVAAVAAGVWFIMEAHRVHRLTAAGDRSKPYRLFIISNNYLAVVFVALSVDAALGLQTLGEGFGWGQILF